MNIKSKIVIRQKYKDENDVTLFKGDRLDFLKTIPDESASLIITSPPYNIGKSYEKKSSLEEYLKGQEETLTESVRVLSEHGSLCWQVGNHINKGEVFPLDVLIYPICKKLGLKLRNRIIWHFEHGLHCKKRLSGRYETIMWFTKSDDYIFNLDPIRVPQKYPGKKNFKGKKAGEYSCNPLGKNPSDMWIFPNVKHNHPEKTEHPCQFPIELVERLVLSMTNENDLVIDPYMGVGSAMCAAIRNKRRSGGSDLIDEYVDIAEDRVKRAYDGTLKVREMGTKVYEPTSKTTVAKNPWKT